MSHTEHIQARNKSLLGSCIYMAFLVSVNYLKKLEYSQTVEKMHVHFSTKAIVHKTCDCAH